MSYKNIKLQLKRIKHWIIQHLTKKQKDLKKNGGLNRRKYSQITHKTWPRFIEKLFATTNLYYLTIVFNGKKYKVNTILWNDELDLLKLTITLPFRYRIYKKEGRKHLEIKLDKVPDIVKDAYEKLSREDFCEYYKKTLKGY